MTKVCNTLNSCSFLRRNSSRPAKWVVRDSNPRPNTRTTYYLLPLLFPTITDIGVAVVDEMPAPVGAAVAVSVTAPRFDGRQVQLATILGDEPEVNLFLHPGIITFFALKVTLDATDTFAVIVTTVL